MQRLGRYRVTEVKAVAVEQWLRSLSYANGSKAKARNIMSAVERKLPDVRMSKRRLKEIVIRSIQSQRHRRLHA